MLMAGEGDGVQERKKTWIPTHGPSHYPGYKPQFFFGIRKAIRRKINGLKFGDRVLCAISEKVRSRVRATDQIFRQGGVEFVVLLPDTGKSEALKIADDIRQLIGDPEFEQAGPITISCGVSEYNAGESPAAWADRTDKTMYLAKQQGRNRVISEDAIAA